MKKTYVLKSVKTKKKMVFKNWSVFITIANGFLCEEYFDHYLQNELQNNQILLVVPVKYIKK